MYIVTVNHPEDTDGVDAPIYEGPSDQAHTVLAAGGYETTTPGLALLVTETSSIAVPLVEVDIDRIHTVGS